MIKIRELINESKEYWELMVSGVKFLVNFDSEYGEWKHSPFEGRGSFKPDITKKAISNIMIDSDDYFSKMGIKDEEFLSSVANKLKKNGIREIMFYKKGRVYRAKVWK